MRLKDIENLIALTKLKSLADTQQLKEANVSRDKANARAMALHQQANGLTHPKSADGEAPLLISDLQQLEKYRGHLLKVRKRELQNAIALEPLIDHLQGKMRTSLRSEIALKSIETARRKDLKRQSDNKEEEGREQLRALSKTLPTLGTS